MKYEYGRCLECLEIVEVACDADNPHFCPECRSVDTIDFEIEDDDE